jgi:hypothetical protein
MFKRKPNWRVVEVIRSGNVIGYQTQSLFLWFFYINVGSFSTDREMELVVAKSLNKEDERRVRCHDRTNVIYP